MVGPLIPHLVCLMIESVNGICLQLCMALGKILAISPHVLPFILNYFSKPIPSIFRDLERIESTTTPPEVRSLFRTLFLFLFIGLSHPVHDFSGFPFLELCTK
jgi:hypothetical protein